MAIIDTEDVNQTSGSVRAKVYRVQKHESGENVESVFAFRLVHRTFISAS